MADTRPDPIKREVSVDLAPMEHANPLPPCPAGWKPEPYFEYDQRVEVSLSHEASGLTVSWWEDDINGGVLNDLENGRPPAALEAAMIELGLDDDAWEALDAYGTAVFHRVDVDAYFLAAAALDAFRDVVAARAVMVTDA